MDEYLCVWIPDWPVAAAISAGMARADQPIAIHDGRRLSAVSAMARASGVRRAMRRREAVARCPNLVVLADDPRRQARTFERVMTAVEQVVAHPVVVRPGLVLAAARGPVGHCGDRWSTLQAVGSAIVAGAGAEAGVGIAHGTLAAILAADVEDQHREEDPERVERHLSDVQIFGECAPGHDDLRRSVGHGQTAELGWR